MVQGLDNRICSMLSLDPVYKTGVMATGSSPMVSVALQHEATRIGQLMNQIKLNPCIVLDEVEHSIDYAASLSGRVHIARASCLRPE